VVASGKLTNYRLKALEERVAKHNSLVERTYVLEGTVRSVCQEIQELKDFHKPGAAK